MIIIPLINFLIMVIAATVRDSMIRDWFYSLKTVLTNLNWPTRTAPVRTILSTRLVDWSSRQNLTVTVEIKLYHIYNKKSETESLEYAHLQVVQGRKYKHFFEEQPFSPVNDHIKGLGDHQISLRSERASSDNPCISKSFWVRSWPSLLRVRPV